MNAFFSEHLCGLIRIYNVCRLNDERAWNLIYDIIFLEPVTTHRVLHIQLMGLHRRSRRSPFQEWWAAFCPYMAQIFDKTGDQMNNWMWDDPSAFRDQVDRSNPLTTS
jgi:hypothetical protein